MFRKKISANTVGLTLYRDCGVPLFDAGALVWGTLLIYTNGSETVVRVPPRCTRGFPGGMRRVDWHY